MNTTNHNGYAGIGVMHEIGVLATKIEHLSFLMGILLMLGLSTIIGYTYTNLQPWIIGTIISAIGSWIVSRKLLKVKKELKVVLNRLY